MEDLEKLQKELDEKKWLESEIAHQDLSGKMFYCNYCPFRDSYLKVCGLPTAEIQKYSQCAKMELIRRADEKAKTYAMFDINENESKGCNDLKNIKQNKKGGNKNV